jgi:hypothetical protein
MEMLVLLLAIVSVSLLPGFLCSIPVGDVEVLYVKPAEPSTECPSGDSPCHSLQYYANHSNFTSNRRFLFLEGEHHLDSVVNVSGVANLSLVGASPGVTILCKSSPSGFYFEKFMNLNFENMVICNCSSGQSGGFLTVNLLGGSEASFRGVTITNSSDGLYGTGLRAEDVKGSLSIFDSSFIAPLEMNIAVTYSLCNTSSTFSFSGNSVVTSTNTALSVEVYCGDLQVLIAHTNFTTFNHANLAGKAVVMYFYEVKNSSIMVQNSTQYGNTYISVMTSGTCDVSSPHCGLVLIDFSKVSLINVAAEVVQFYLQCYGVLCHAVFKDSTFTPGLLVSSTYNTKRSMNDSTSLFIFQNVTFVGLRNSTTDLKLMLYQLYLSTVLLRTAPFPLFRLLGPK